MLNFFVKILFPAATLAALFYQIGKDIYSKIAKYRVEITRCVGRSKTDKFSPEFAQYLMTIRNTGNRELTITEAGFVKRKDLENISSNNVPLYNFFKCWVEQGSCVFPFKLKPGEMANILFDGIRNNFTDYNGPVTVQKEWQKEIGVDKLRSKDRSILLAVRDSENRLHFENLEDGEYYLKQYKRNRIEGYKGYKDSLFK